MYTTQINNKIFINNKYTVSIIKSKNSKKKNKAF